MGTSLNFDCPFWTCATQNCACKPLGSRMLCLYRNRGEVCASVQVEDIKLRSKQINRSLASGGIQGECGSSRFLNPHARLMPSLVATRFRESSRRALCHKVHRLQWL